MNDTQDAHSPSEEKGMIRKNITLPPDILERGQLRAKKERRSFANYVASLIERDTQNAQPELRMPA